ncbi:MAG: amidohydrolase family protein, partial [Actinomycetota bacterium]|nr:amidohydrolase family protein [Actinomycetota bacterium]
MADTVIRNVSIVDGTGSKMFGGDVVIDEGRIAEVGSATSKCNEEVDGSGLVLAPGFVDVHTHDDGALIQHPGMAFKVSQGCTSVVVGNCGFSAVPAVNGEKTLDLSNIESQWQDLEGYRRVVEDGNVAINSMMLMGHNTIRSLEMKDLRDQPTDKQLESMRQHVQKGMEQG